MWERGRWVLLTQWSSLSLPLTPPAPTLKALLEFPWLGQGLLTWAVGSGCCLGSSEVWLPGHFPRRERGRGGRDGLCEVAGQLRLL